MQRSKLAQALSAFGSRWIGFWFAPQDPTLLGLMRILAGLVTLYTIVIHGLTLPQFMGANAWCDVNLRLEQIHEQPYLSPPIAATLASGNDLPIPAPSNEFERDYLAAYHTRWGYPPPFCYPKNKEEADFADAFRSRFGFDFRAFGLPFPRKGTDEEWYLQWYSELFKLPSPPPYPAADTLQAMKWIYASNQKREDLPKSLSERPDVKEQLDRVDFMGKWSVDPRRMYDQGPVVWSIWLHVTDPFWMNVVQTVFVIAAVCMVLGLGTRVAIPIVWFANLSYIHRNPFILFGVDTMMNVLLLYFMIGPSGAALSLDRLLFRRKTMPLASAGFVYRLMQIHLSIIYFVSGISKLRGESWWNGLAVWNVLANYEFAPMTLPIYREFLRWLGQNQLLFELFVTGSGYATLAFEIGYPFLMWQHWSRRPMLWGAVFLHGFIGMFMGLKTFSLMMLVFNMAFLTASETQWILERFRFLKTTTTASAEPPNSVVEAAESAPIATAS